MYLLTDCGVEQTTLVQNLSLTRSLKKQSKNQLLAASYNAPGRSQRHLPQAQEPEEYGILGIAGLGTAAKALYVAWRPGPPGSLR